MPVQTPVCCWNGLPEGQRSMSWSPTSQLCIICKTARKGVCVVCYTAVFSVVTQRSSPLTAAENRTTFLSLRVCGLTNKPIMYKKLDNAWAAGRQERTCLSVSDKSINRRWILMSSVSASNEKVFCRKVCFKRLTTAKWKKKKRFGRPTRLLPGSVSSF